MDDRRQILHDLPLFRLLPPAVRTLVVESFVPVSFAFGAPIIREGEPADAFYVLTSGRARVVKQAELGGELSLNVLRAGDSFGEMGLLKDSVRMATVRANTEVEAWRLDRAVFLALVREHPGIRHQLELQVTHRHLQNFFRQYSPFTGLPVEAVQTMLGELERVPVKSGELIIRQGEAPGPMYIVEESRLRVFVEEDGRRRYLAYVRSGDFFGEKSLFTGAQRAASVEAVGPGWLLRLTPETFHKLVAVYPDFRSQIEARIAQYDYKHVAKVPLDFEDELLPAEVRAHEKVGPSQVDHDVGEAEPAEADETAPFASPDGHFVKQPGRIRRFPHVRQIDEMDCGAAALAMVCRHFGRAVSLARIRQLVHTNVDGTSLRALCSAAAELGLAARSVKASKNHLSEMPLPAIVHWEGNHWVVLYDVDTKHARIADPATGLRRVSRHEFDAKWTGYAALFDYTHEFDRAPEGRSSFAWLLPFLRPFTGLLGRALGLAVIVSALQMVLPVFTQIIVDRVVIEQDVDLLRTLMLSMAVVLVFMTVAMLVQRYLLAFAAVHIDSAALDFVTRKLLVLPMAYFSSRRTGDIQRRLEGLRQVREVLVQNGVMALTALVQLAAALALMFFYSPTARSTRSPSAR